MSPNLLKDGGIRSKGPQGPVQLPKASAGPSGDAGTDRLGLCSQPPRDSGAAPGPPKRTRGQGGADPLHCVRNVTRWLLLFRELSMWTRRASLLTSTQTTHSTRSTDLKSPQTLEEQLWERFREEFCETVCNTTDFNTTVLNTICKPLNIGDLGSPQSTQEDPGRHPGGVRDGGREGPGQAGAPGPARTGCEVHVPFHCGQTPALQHQPLVSTKTCPSGSFP